MQKVEGWGANASNVWVTKRGSLKMFNEASMGHNFFQIADNFSSVSPPPPPYCSLLQFCSLFNGLTNILNTKNVQN